MFSWFQKLKVEIEEGAKGHWRWFCYRDGKLVAQSPVAGFNTPEDAQASARTMLKGRLEWILPTL